MENCDICNKSNTTIKCTDCTFKSCEPCIIKWYENSDNFPCPMCKKSQTYDIDFSKVHIRENEEVEHLQMDVLNVLLNALNLNNNELTQQLRSNVLGSSVATESMENFQNLISEGQVFAPDEFEENYNRWPEEIKNIWTYRPIHMRIDEEEEVVGFIIRNRNNI